MKHFDVLVVGGGHAGTEAAAAAARMGARTALVTLQKSKIGVMSCNPAIGGLGKGHLVREIDALDGVMGVAADQAGIQFRLLNRRKGPAVQGPRAQADRRLYRAAVQELLARTEGLEIVEGEVSGIRISKGRAAGVDLVDGSALEATSVILTTGTFLNGVMHIGEQKREGGRVGDPPSALLGQQLGALGLARGRLKTGTPPRLDGRSIRWEALEKQAGDDVPVLFSTLSSAPAARQIECAITHTNEETHAIVRQNLTRSAMYGGHIDGVGPRYCPSLEDKVVRFSEKSSHQVFLEPEGLDDPTVYPNGISSSLPGDVQERYVRSIRGLEEAVITQLGYAIEYDYFDPRGLSAQLEVRALPGLFFAGQINGTTGYEEAAAQGLVAGLSAAARSREHEPPTFSRADSYMGVMIDDLTTLGVSEPYRMFTSRAEYRLALRADNADQRLTPKGIGLGCVSENRKAAFEEKAEALARARAMLEAHRISARDLFQAGLVASPDGGRRTAFECLALPGVGDHTVALFVPGYTDIAPEIRAQVARDALYAPYLERQNEEARTLRREEETEIPAGLVYLGMPGLSAELATKLDRQRPLNLMQARKMEGMTPAALTLILAHARKARREKKVK